MPSAPMQIEPAAERGQRPMLLIGRGGMLGRAWSQLMARSGTSFEAAGRDEVDLTDPASIEQAVFDYHGVVVNCAAYAHVDRAESEMALADRVNGEGVGALARRCARTGSLLVHYSTDYVFSGQLRRPYGVNDTIRPLNAYGRSKALGEEKIRQSGCRHLIVRTSWLYAPWGRNFIRTMAQRMAQEDELRVVHDQRGRPTSCEHLARCTMKLIQRGMTGTVHITDGGECSWFELARETARLIGWRGRMMPCASAEFPRPARRPAYTVLDISETEKLLGPMPHWKENLAEVVRRLEV